MHNVPIDFLAACAGTLVVLQGLSVLLANLEKAARRIEGRSTWIAHNGAVFEEFEVSELEGSWIMQQDFEETRGEALVTGPLSLQANG